MKKIKIYEEDGKTVIEVPEGASVEVRNKKPEFKKGDFIVTEHGDKLVIVAPYIYQSVCRHVKTFELNDCRLMTDAEKAEFTEALHKAGIDWDGENIVDWKWIPKYGEKYWVIYSCNKDGIIEYTNSDDHLDKNSINNGLYWRTKEEAKEAVRRARG